ncbi:PRC-barrel domain-containing protein [Oceanobacillus alkalisoli]|uniref:PRC-barrel domain-containing protein n=1 Tax=Oceanobacillus alkalisoli TaxID=2925113 RepID=UPI001F11B1F7|nr:PRC-barrel domain-containing protein [Oceanobacillus alkalisoli]MCF3942003.1 PRC-barrel domain-containing protein [Oceanobacillus alkalisoli]
MYHFTSVLQTYNIDATDGEMGKIKDIYIDDNDWKIRYAIVDTRKWLPERKVLLPPSIFIGVNPENESMEVEYDKSTIKNSPPVPEGTDLTRDKENQLFKYFGWTRYWSDDVILSGEKRPLGRVGSNEEEWYERMEDPLYDADEGELRRHHRDNNLRSHEEIMNSRAHGKNGKLGKVVDFIYDDDWKVKYIVLTSNNVMTNDYYPYPIERITSVDWFEGDVYLDETVEQFANKTNYPSNEDILKALQ